MAFNSWGNPYYGMNYGMGYGIGYGYSNWHLGFGSFWGNPYYLLILSVRFITDNQW